MSTEKNAGALSRFVDAATRRLWLFEFTDCLHTGLWIVAAALLVLGGIHVGLIAVSPSVLLLVTTVVAAWVLLRTIVRKPTPSYAAVEIDRLFAAETLVATAVECLHSAPEERSPASNIVIKRANDSAQCWNDRLKETIRPGQRTAARIALVPLFAATLLLVQPGANIKDSPRTQAQTTVDQSERVAARTDDDSLDTVAQVRRELADEKATQALSQLTPDDRSNPTRNEDVDADDRTQPRDDRPPENARLRSASTDKTSGDDAGDGSSSESTSDSQAVTRFDQTRQFAVLRTGQATAATTASDRQYSKDAISVDYSGVRPLPAAAPESGRDKSTLSAAEAAYAARYLSATGENNE